MENSHTQKIVLFSALVLLVAAGAIYTLYQYLHITTAAVEPTYCTMDAMECPDGSYVGRTGPDCEFAACPAVDDAPVDPNMTEVIDSERRVTFSYPKSLGSDYLRLNEQPVVTVISGSVDCMGNALHIVDGGSTYCVTESSEGAAGSTYTTYTYDTERNGNKVTVTFVVQMPQCLNYDEPMQGACKKDQEAFNPDELADQIVESIVLLK